MAITPDQFREGMRRLASSVTVLGTALDDGARFGMTATAVSSVSSEPPTLLCCINRDSQTREAVARAGRFSVNVLAAGDEQLANRFAQRITHDERFAVGNWGLHPLNVPILDTAAVWFACRTVQSVEAGSHTVFFGEIVGTDTRGSHVRPLLYAHGGYGSFGESALPDFMRTPDWKVQDQ